jgi:bifunctional DNase/RNase
MELSRILIRETDDMHIVELREVDGERVFPIVIGLNEAAAIERRLMGQKPPRPLTHELLANVINSLHAELEKIVICDLKKSTFFARIYLRHNGELIDIDSRPSDAIALGVAEDVPIFVAEEVLEEACRDL